MKKYIISQIAWLLCLLLAITGCSNDMSSSFSDDGEIKPGDPVMFTTHISGKVGTRTYEDGEATAGYTFTYFMYKKEESSNTFVTSGPTVYWPDISINKYGFMATAGTPTLEDDQRSDTNLLNQDLLLGYAGISGTDNLSDFTFRTGVDWKTALGGSKIIPVYLDHQRSKITIILKAGEGVARADLASETAGDNIEATIYSYPGSTAVDPYASSTTVDYTDATGVETTQYTAIVEPYDYRTETTSGDGGQVVAEIKLSGQRFTFKPSNETAVDKSNYNLTAGTHLIIEATLARGNDQKVLLTAQIVPWDVISIDATVGDDGMVGSTTNIANRSELLTFLSGENNIAGNIANITADINLEDGGVWTSLPLNCTLKLNGHTLSTTHPVFTTIGALGKVEGGTISVSGDATVDAAIATTNHGTIKDVTVSRNSTGKASQGGLVVTNSGTISSCSSTLPVHGTSGVVGGIAKESVYSTIGSMPVIENCTVDARVDGEDGTSGGGIVGSAVGRVSGNTYAYGITLNQNDTNFKNIILAKADFHELRAYDNKWPTKADNSIGDHSSNNLNTTTATKYDATIDSSDELWTLLFYPSTNAEGKNYRVNCDFTVVDVTSGATWTSNISNKEALCHLDGNGKNITTDPSNLVLFANVSTATTNLYVNNVLVSTTP